MLPVQDIKANLKALSQKKGRCLLVKNLKNTSNELLSS